MNTINTIFRFVDSESTYHNEEDQISARTIVFCENEGSIWKNGVQYTGGSSSTSGDSVVVTPKYTTGTEIAVIKVGNDSKTLYAPTGSSSDIEIIPANNNGPEIGKIKLDGTTYIFKSPISGGSGEGGTTYIENPFDPTELNDKINALERELAEKWAAIDDSVKDEIEDLFKEKDWLDTNLKGVVQSYSNFGESDVEEYLQRIGMYDEDENGNKTWKWSSIQQEINSLTNRVAAVEVGADPKDITELEATLKQYVDEETNTAINNLSTLYARKKAEDIILWMHSGLTQGSGENKTWNDLSSAASSGNYGALANISSAVEKLEDGTFLAKADLVSSIEEKKGDVVTVLSSAGVMTSSDLNNATSTLYSKIGDVLAAIDTTVKKKDGKIEPEVSISANQIYLSGTTWADLINAEEIVTNTLSAGNATISGNIEAKSFKVMDGNTESIVFTTMSSTLRSQYNNLDASGIDDGAPVGLVYSNGTPKYFFDFAPLTKTGNTTHPTYVYTLKTGTGAANSEISQTVTVYVDDYGRYYRSSEGTDNYLANSGSTNIPNNTYCLDTVGDDAMQYAIMVNGNNKYEIVWVKIYRPCKFKNGVMEVSNKNAMVVTANSGYYLHGVTSGPVLINMSDVANDERSEQPDVSDYVYLSYINSPLSECYGTLSIQTYDDYGNLKAWAPYTFDKTSN